MLKGERKQVCIHEYLALAVVGGGSRHHFAKSSILGTISRFLRFCCLYITVQMTISGKDRSWV